MDWINYHHLYYFWTIAKEGSVTRASKKLRLSQPTLSGQLRHFEDFLKQPLFERKSRKLILNDTGKVVLEYADSIFRMGKEMMEHVGHPSAANLEAVHVGVLATLPKKPVHKFLKPLLASSKVSLHATLGSLDELMFLLVNHQLDFILSHHRPLPIPQGVSCHQLEHSPFILAASPEFRSLKKNLPQSLNKQNFFLPSEEATLKAEIEQMAKRHNLNLNIKGEIQDSELLRIIALNGDGIVVISKSAISDLIKTKELTVLGEDLKIAQNIYLIGLEKKLTHPVVRDILAKYI